MRWRHPTRGLVSPAEFIPLAKETGLILPLGDWVLRTTCTEAFGWPEAIRVAVNLSPVQFRDDRLPDMVEGIVRSTGLPAERLEFEITEGVMLDDQERTLAMLSRLKATSLACPW